MKDVSTYRKRIADKLLSEQLEASGAVLVQGPKWCGKTTTAEQIAGSIIYMDEPKNRMANMILAETDPQVLLQGAVPRVIDEWQLAPLLWDTVRFEVSHRRVPGQFILTGSAVPPDLSGQTHSGIGRIARLTMRTMSLWESGESNGSVSLASMFSGEPVSAASAGTSLEMLAYQICRGGWPGSLGLSPKAALRQASNYVDAVAESDISRVDGVSRDADFARRLMRSYARHQGGQVPVRTIYEDLLSNQSGSMSEDTIASYIMALKKIFVIEDLQAWNPNLRSKTAIRTSDTRFFSDPSIAAASLGVGPDDLLSDLNTLGLLFETMAVRDLRVYADALDGRLYHYRDKTGLECDAVIHLRNGRYGMIEIKLGGDTLIESGARNLLKLAGKIDTGRMSTPSFLMVLTGTGQYAYRRSDNVCVVPINCLKD